MFFSHERDISYPIKDIHPLLQPILPQANQETLRMPGPILQIVRDYPTNNIHYPQLPDLRIPSKCLSSASLPLMVHPPKWLPLTSKGILHFRAISDSVGQFRRQETVWFGFVACEEVGYFIGDVGGFEGVC